MRRKGTKNGLLLDCGYLETPLRESFTKTKKAFCSIQTQFLVRFKQKNQRIPRFKNVLDIFNPRILVLNLFLSNLTYSPQRCRNKSLSSYSREASGKCFCDCRLFQGFSPYILKQFRK